MFKNDWDNTFIPGTIEKSLTKKLGITGETRILVINEPKNYFQLLTDLPDETLVFFDRKNINLDIIHYFTTSFEQFKVDLPILKEQILKNGAIWISWPKKSSGIQSDLDENKIRNLAIEFNLVDIKVCSIDSIWSGLKLVYRVKDREFKALLDEI